LRRKNLKAEIRDYLNVTAAAAATAAVNIR
jgi:hypothetical protein